MYKIPVCKGLAPIIMINPACIQQQSKLVFYSMLKQSSQIITRLLLVISCLLAGCSSMQGPGIGLPSAVLSTHPQKVALLVPLQGQYGPSGQAIRNGFLAAYFNDKQQNPNVPTVNVTDTSQGNVTSIYQQAVTSGASLVVGPLTKPEVQTLASSGSLAVPVLALNSLEGNQNAPGNMYFYSLSPRDEADQAAQKASQAGYHRVIIIAPASAWGQSLAQAFTNRWQAQGGQVVDNVAFTPKQNLSSAIGNVLHVDKSIVSSQGFKKALKDKVPLDQMRRQDFDVIFLVASPQQARLIKPLLKFYFAGNIPVYATSAIYSGRPSPNADRDLDGIIFCDMPWVLAGPNQLPANVSNVKARVATLWPNSYNSYSKLYAMGVDAYQLSSHLAQLPGSPGLSGATGSLYLGPQHQVLRQLSWAQFRNGIPVPL